MKEVVEVDRERSLERFDRDRVLAGGVHVGQVDVIRGAVRIKAEQQGNAPFTIHFPGSAVSSRTSKRLNATSYIRSGISGAS